jgi:hypothetical protein
MGHNKFLLFAVLEFKPFLLTDPYEFPTALAYMQVLELEVRIQGSLEDVRIGFVIDMEKHLFFRTNV